MNTHLSLINIHLDQLPVIDLLASWLVAPAAVAYTYEDWIGDPQDELACCEQSSCSPLGTAPGCIPQVDADEFEREYLWFLS